MANDLGATTLARAAARLDAVDFLLERRRWEADREFDLVSSVTLYSDGSPVTGEELQGMVMDVCKRDGNHRRVTLPGATLFYGNMSAMSKGVTLLWACYLMAGPSFEAMSYFVSKVICICTDGGVELGTLMLPNILQAFAAWCGGTKLTNLSYTASVFFQCFAHFWLVPLMGQPHAIPCGTGDGLETALGENARGHRNLAKPHLARAHEESDGRDGF